MASSVADLLIEELPPLGVDAEYASYAADVLSDAAMDDAEKKSTLLEMWMLAAQGGDTVAGSDPDDLSARFSLLLDRAIVMAQQVRDIAAAAAAVAAQAAADALAQRIATATATTRAPERVEADLDAAVKRAIVAGFAYESETDEEEEKAMEKRREAKAASTAAAAAREVRRSAVNAAGAAGAGLDSALEELSDLTGKASLDTKGASACTCARLVL